MRVEIPRSVLLSAWCRLTIQADSQGGAALTVCRIPDGKVLHAALMEAPEDGELEIVVRTEETRT